MIQPGLHRHDHFDLWIDDRVSHTAVGPEHVLLGLVADGTLRAHVPHMAALDLDAGCTGRSRFSCGQTGGPPPRVLENRAERAPTE